MARRRVNRLNLTPLEDRVTPATLYTVNSAADTNARDGVLTLREALLAERGDLTGLDAGEAAQVQSGATGLTRDTVRFTAALGGQTIAFTANDAVAANRYGPTGFVVTTAVDVDGRAGAGRGVTLSGSGVQRLFAITSTGDLGLTNLELVNGLAKGGAGAAGGGGAAGLGGAIFVDQGKLAVSASTFTGNQAIGGAGGGGGLRGAGGGLAGDAVGSTGGGPNGGTLGVSGGYGGGGGGSNAVLLPSGPGNAAGIGGFGGGAGAGSLYFNASGQLTAISGGSGGFGGGGEGRPGFAGGSSSSIKNPATVATGGGGGGGIGGAIFSNAGTVTVSASTFTANAAVGGAGGTSSSPDGSKNVTGGAGKGYGGAIFSRNGSLVIASSTLADNTAAAAGTSVAVVADSGTGGGGGDTANTGHATLTLKGSILGQASAAGTDLVTLKHSSGRGLDMLAPATDIATGSGNLIRTTAVTTVSGLAGDPQLGPLQDNGGPTRTMLPAGGSPAVDAVPGGTGTDQRGLPRGVGGLSDIGSVELQSTLSPATLPAMAIGVGFSAAITATAGAGPWTFAVTAGTLPPGLALSATDPAVLSGTPTTVGPYAFTITATAAGGATASRQYTGTVAAAPSISPAALPAAMTDTAYSATLTVSGSPGATTYAVTSGSLPAGLLLSAAGVLAGMPAVGGSFSFTVTAATAAYGTVTRAYTLTVNYPPVTITPTTLPAGQVGTAYSQTLTAAGGAGSPYVFDLITGSPPAGLSLSAAGVLSGTPTTADTFTFTVTATAANGQAGNRDYSLVVVPPVTISPPTVPGGRVSVAYSQTLTAAGPAGPAGRFTFRFAVATGTLPPGITLSATGLLAGTPTAEGNFTFAVAATSAAGWAGSRTYTVAVAPAPAVTVGPAALPDAVIGAAYAQTVTASGEAPPYAFAVTAGTLPPGLALTAAGQLAGTPTTAGSYPFTVTATSADPFTGRRDYTVVVRPPVTITPATLPAGVVGTPYAQTLTASGGAGGPFAFALAAGNLPPGLTLTAAGALAGTPTAAGTFTFAVTATAAVGPVGTRVYTLTVNYPPVTITPATLPAGQAGTSYGQPLTAAGGAGGPYTFAAGTLPPGLSLSNAGVLAGTPATAGTFTVTFTVTSAGGQSGPYTYALEVVPAVTFSPGALPGGRLTLAYDRTLTASGPTGPYTFAVTAGRLPPGLTLSAGSITGTPTAAGDFPFAVTATSSAGWTGSRDYAITVGPAPLVTVGPADLSDPQVGTAYEQTLTASGEAAPYTFAATGTLPPGLTLTPAGRLAGTPTAAGVYSFSVTATSADPFTGSRGYTVVVQPPVTVGPAGLPDGQVGHQYAQPLTAAGPAGPYTFAVTAGSLPPGLTLTATGGLDGVPSAAGDFPFTVTATSAAGWTGTRVYAISIVPPVTVAPATLPGGRVSLAYGQTLTASGPAGPYTFAVADGGLPPGLALSAGGQLAGTPTAAGSFSFAVTARSAAGWTGTAAYTLTVGPAPVVTVGPVVLPDPQVGTPYTQAVTASGEAGPYAFAVTAGGLPPGLTLSAAGGLAGTPTAAGPFAFTVTASSADGFPGSRSYAGVVQPPVTVGPDLLADDVVTVPYDQTLTASGPAGPYTFAVTAGSLPPGLALSSAGRLSGTPTLIGDYAFTVTAASADGYAGRRDYAVAIVAPGVVTIRPATLPDAQVGTAYGQLFTASGEVGPFTFAVTAGTLPPGLALAPTGDLAGTPTTAGPSAFTVTATSAGGFAGDRSYALVVVPPVVVGPAALPGGRATVAYDQTLTASGPGGPYTFTVTGGALPAGLTLTDAGRLFGTPTAAAGFSFTVTATSAAGWEGVAAYVLTIGPAPVVTVGPTALPTTQVGAAYDQIVTAVGEAGPYTFAVAGALPPGLTLSAAGRLTGTPTAAGRYAFTVTATSTDPFTGRRDYTVVVHPPVTIAPAMLPAGHVGAAYAQTLTASGGSGGPYTFAVTAGALPPGLTLSDAGVLAGTPTAAGTFAVTATATAAGGQTGNRDYTLAVVPPVAIAPGTLPGGRVSIAYDQTLTASGPAGPYAFAVSAGSLPPGLSLSAAGRITGTPTATVSSTVTVTAKSAAGWAGTADYMITVGPAPVVTVGPAALPDPQVGAAYDQTLTAAGEAGPYTFSVAGTLPPGLTLSAAGRLTGTPTTAGDYTVTVTAEAAAGWRGTRDYAVRIAASPVVTVGPTVLLAAQAGEVYARAVAAAGAAGPYTFAVAGTLPPGLTLSPTTGTLTGTPTADGDYTFTVTATSAGGYTGGVVTTLTVYPVTVIGPDKLPTGTGGYAYGQSIAAGPGGPYTFAVTAGALPRGLTLSPAGELAGNPTDFGTFRFTVTASAAGRVGRRVYELWVAPNDFPLPPNAPGVVMLDATAPAAGRVGDAFAGRLTATGGTGPYTFTLAGGALPAGLTLAADGTIAGTPTEAGTFPFTATATSVEGAVGARDYVLTVAPRPVVIVGPAALPIAQVGAAYAQTLTASGAVGTYQFTVAGGTLPPGLSLAADGTLVGIPVQAGTFTFTAAASADGVTGTHVYTVAVVPAVLLDPAALPVGRVGDAYTAKVTAAGPAGPFAFALTAGGLPPGLTLLPTGDFRGTPTAAGSFAFTIGATTPANDGGRQDYRIVVAPAAVVPPSPPAVAAATAVGGSDGTLTVLGPDGRPTAALAPFPGFTGGVRTAVLAAGRVAVGTGPGPATGVKVIDPATGATLFDLAPFEPAFTGGVFVSAGDLFGTGTPQVAVSPDEGGGPRVRIVDPTTGEVRLDFFGIDDPAFRGGARTAIGDVTGDGVPDLIVAAGFGGGPRVTIWDGVSLRAGTPRAVANFFAFEPTLRNGVYAAAGDLDGDGFADPVLGGGPGGGPRVLALSGRDLTAGGPPAVLANFFAGDAAARGGVPVAVKDVDGDGRADVVTGSGPGTRATVRAFAGPTLAASPDELFAYDAGDLMNGVYVG